MKRIIIIGLLIGTIILSGCVQTNRDSRCSMPKPNEVGYCEPINGYYYDSDSNTCMVISGCSVDGEIPFTSQQDCEKTLLC